MISSKNARFHPTVTDLVSKKHLIFSTTFLIILSRLLPHPPGVTALTSYCLLSGTQSKNTLSLTVLLIIAFLSDLVIGIRLHSFFGSWMLFTYSGYSALFLLGYTFRNHSLRMFSRMSLLALGSLIFWLWTNFGVWLLSGLYPHSMQGLFNCYYFALPFLRNGLLGDLGFGILIIYSGCFQIADYRVLSLPSVHGIQ